MRSAGGIMLTASGEILRAISGRTSFEEVAMKIGFALPHQGPVATKATLLEFEVVDL